MFNATMLAENRHTVLRRPLDALKIKNFRTFTFTELVDVQAAADILTHDIMPIVRMTRRVAWPSLCDAMAEWMVQFEKSDVVLGQTSQSVSYRPRYDACRNLGVGLEMVTTLALVVYTCIMGIEPPTKS